MARTQILNIYVNIIKQICTRICKLNARVADTSELAIASNADLTRSNACGLRAVH